LGKKHERKKEITSVREQLDELNGKYPKTTTTATTTTTTTAKEQWPVIFYRTFISHMLHNDK
jgi:hypothetical protein